MALSRWSWEGRQTDRRRFSLLIHDTAAVSTTFCSDLICPASPTHKYFTNTSHTRDLAERPHTPGCHTPSLILFRSPSLWFRLFVPVSSYSALSLFHLSRVLQVHSVWEKPLTEDNMLRATVPHTVLCNWMAVGVAYWLKWYFPLLQVHSRNADIHKRAFH